MAGRGTAPESRTKPLRGRLWRTILVGLLVLIAALVGLLWHPGAGEPMPELVYETGADGVRTARIDIGRLTAWCRHRDLPDPPAMDSAEPAVAEALFEALELAAAERSGAAFGQVGRIYGSLDAHRAAADFFDLAMATDPGDSRWPYHLGCVYQETGQSDRAIESLESAMALNPEYPVTFARLGQLYLDGGRNDEAATMFRRYASMRPEDWLGFVGLGRLALERGAAREALGHLERAERIRPDDFQVQYNLGRVHAALGDRDAAQMHFDRAAELPQGAWFRARDPLDQELHDSSRSAASLATEFERLSETSDWPRLAELAEEIVARRPNDTTMLANLASIYRKMRRFDDAHEILDRGLAQRPNSIRLLAVRSEVHLAQGSYAEALAAAEVTLELEPDHLRSQAVRGRALFRLGRHREAEETLRLYTGRVPGDAVSLYVLGESLLAQGKLADAATTFERVLELQPGFEPAQQRLLLLRQKR